MKNLTKLIILAVSLTLMLSSCSEESNDTPDNTSIKYFPTTVDSWWTYTNYDLDDDGNPDESTIFETKTVITGKENKSDKEATIFSNQILDGTEFSKDYFVTTNSQILSFGDLLPEMDFTMPFEIPEDWYVITDENKTEWVLHTENITDLDFPVAQGTVKLNGDFVIKAEKEGKERVNYGANSDNTVEAYKWKLSYAFVGTGNMFVDFPLEFAVETYRWYADDIGLVKFAIDPMTISVEILGQTQEVFSMKGGEQILLDYIIAE